MDQNENRTLRSIERVSELGYYSNSFPEYVSRRKSFSDVTTGFPSLDSKLGHLNPGLYVIGAASGMGKTTFVHQLCSQVAKAGGTTCYVSYEQSAAELVSKSLSRMTKAIGREPLTASQIRDGERNPTLDEAVRTYAEEIGDRSIVATSANGYAITIDDLVAFVKSEAIPKTGSRIVAIDYLQLIGRNERHERLSTKEFVDVCVNELKRLSMAENVPVFLISTINRQNYLNLIDFESFKESSMIEASADVVLGLQPSILRSETFRSNGDVNAKRKALAEAKERIPREVELTCLKNRAGVASFTQEFEYDPRYDLFTEKTEPTLPKIGRARKTTIV